MLTPTEAKVAALAGKGFSRKRIAHEIGISELTIASHLHRCYVKTGTECMAQLGLWQRQQELLRTLPEVARAIAQEDCTELAVERRLRNWIAR